MSRPKAFDDALDELRQQGAEAERAAIVAWLRELAATDTAMPNYLRAANAIESGSHLQGKQGR